jgi:uncharacterized protein (TIGR02145 family)
MKKYYAILLVFLVAVSSCKKDDVAPTTTTTITIITPPTKVTDADGNVYDTVQIGTQVWLSQNLQTTHYNDGSLIPTVTDNSAWSTLTNGATCYYNNDAANAATYGMLYNWYAVVDPVGICPPGWHIPSNAEWDVLTNYLGGGNVAGGAMKAISALWGTTNMGATNSSGLACLPAGTRYNVDGAFYSLGIYGGFWSSTASNENMAYDRLLSASSAGVYLYSYSAKNCGLSIRCVKD